VSFRFSSLGDGSLMEIKSFGGLYRMIKLKLTVLFLVCFFFSEAQEMPAWINKHGVPIDSTLSQKAFFSSLEGEHHIMLGEPTHGDGSVLDYKVNLIKKLHQEQDFDVILFEADMLNFFIAEQQKAPGAGALINATLPPMWRNARELQALITYIDEQNSLGDSLFVAGFDTQLTPGAVKHLNTALPVFLKNNNIALSSDEGSNGLDEHRNFFSTLVILINKGLRNNPNIASKLDFKRFENTLNDLKVRSSGLKSADGKFWTQELGNIADYLPLLYKMNNLPQHFTVAEASLRDSIMANNYRYQIKERFKGKKTITWAATDHIRRNIPGEKSKKMGQYLSEQTVPRPYVVGFTAGAGQYYNYIDKNTYDIPALTAGSFEYFARKLKKGDLFVDFKANKDKMGRNALAREISMRPLAYQPKTNDWATVLDAIIYIDHAKASHMIK
jgi:erythromycin esterase-like protein